MLIREFIKKVSFQKVTGHDFPVIMSVSFLRKHQAFRIKKNLDQIPLQTIPNTVMQGKRQKCKKKLEECHMVNALIEAFTVCAPQHS